MTPAPAGVSRRRTAARWLPPFSIPTSRRKSSGHRTASSPGALGRAELCVVPGGFRLTGAWNFASGSHHASWLGAHVVTPDPDGAPLCRADGGEIVRTLLFPKSRATMTDIWHVVGLRGTGSDRYSVTDLFIPERYTVLRDPTIAPRQPGRLHSISSSNLYACGVAAVALGIARGMVADFTELATKKTPGGARRGCAKTR